jgi:hypothetical protein
MSLVSFKIADSADQQFSVSLNQRRTTFRLRYNPTNDRWSFNLAVDDKMVLHGRRVVTGIDLLEPFDLGIGIVFAGTDRIGIDNVEPGRSQLIDGEVKIFHALEEDVKLAMEEVVDAIAISS